MAPSWRRRWDASPTTSARRSRRPYGATATRTGRLLQICHVLRYAPLYRAIKQVIDSGEIGDVIALRDGVQVEMFT